MQVRPENRPESRPAQPRLGAVRFVVENLGWMLGSLALAVIVWYAATSAQNPVAEKRLSSRIPVTITKNDNLVIVNTPPDAAFVSIRAPQTVWNVLEPADVSVILDLTKLGPGTYTLPLTATLSGARQGVITDIEPSQVSITLATRLEAMVPIDVTRTTEPPPGLTSNPTLPISTAKVSGPDTLVTQVVKVEAPISLQDHRARFTQTVQLVPVDNNNKEVAGVTVNPTQVTIDMDIEPRADVTELSVSATFSGELPAGYRRKGYTYDPQSVAVRGDRTAIDAMNGVITTDAIDLTGKTENFSEHIKLALPTGVTLVDPTDVTVTVEIEPIQGSREFDNVPVLPQGLDLADYEITIQPDHVNIIVNGPQPALDTMAASDISVIAPLSGLIAGNKYPVTLQASVTKAGINNQDVVIPNARAEVSIIARNPTVTPTTGPTRIPTLKPTVETPATSTAAP